MAIFSFYRKEVSFGMLLPWYNNVTGTFKYWGHRLAVIDNLVQQQSE